MPPTGRRRARNKEPEQRAAADAEGPEPNTPSRKRRRVNGPDKAASASKAKPTRRASAASDETIEHQEGDNEEGDGLPDFSEAEMIIPRLRTAPYAIAAAMDFSNTIQPSSETAFAKIAGRNWTYYAKSPKVVIGRPNASERAKRESGEAATGTPTTGSKDMQVDIDLGPDQQISRVHAHIEFDGDRQEWILWCNGRNGLHVDDSRLDRGHSCILHSGVVLNILGTQMIFILPNETPVINEYIRDSLLVEAGEDGDTTAPERKTNQGTNRRLAGKQTNGNGTATARGQTASGTQAAHALAALSSSQITPGTPIPRTHAPQPKSKNSPAYQRGLMLESTEEIDYSADSAKDIKPPHSYAQMIGQAILSREEENATLAQIYDFIKERYAFFRHGGGGWQNSIRHNLSLSKHFEKIPRRTDEPGKGMKWQIVPEFHEEYMKKNFYDNRKAPQPKLGSSGPTSPAQYTAPGVQTERLVGALNGMDASRIKRYSRSPSPQPYPVPNESFTPDRGPRLRTSNLPQNGVAPPSATSDIITPTFDRTHNVTSHQTYSAGSGRGGGPGADSPPTLVTGFDNAANPNVFTPLPARQAPKLHLMSTIKPPSFYAKELFSSPAPFWKYAELPHSTPMRPLNDPSPEKLMKPAPAEDELRTDKIEPSSDDRKDEDMKVDKMEEDTELPPPSSPLGAKHAAEALEESPSRTVSRPGSRRDAAPTVNGLENVPKLPPPAQPKFGIASAAINAPSFKMYSREADTEDEDDEDGIDLTKNFQKIGQFHRAMQASTR